MYFKRYNWFSKPDSRKKCAFWKGIYKCIESRCQANFEIRLEENVRVGETVFLNVVISDFIEHDVSRKPIRCSGPEREKLKLKIAALGVSKVQTENIIFNKTEKFSKNCKKHYQFYEKDLIV